MSRRRKGRQARFICDRTGREFPYSEAVKEPGTGYVVAKRYSDGMYNLVDHPQNKPAKFRRESVPLPLMRPDINQADEASLLSYSSTLTDYISDEHGNNIYY